MDSHEAIAGTAAFDQVGATMQSHAAVLGQFARALRKEGFDGDSVMNMVMEYHQQWLEKVLNQPSQPAA